MPVFQNQTANCILQLLQLALELLGRGLTRSRCGCPLLRSGPGINAELFLCHTQKLFICYGYSINKWEVREILPLRERTEKRPTSSAVW